MLNCFCNTTATTEIYMTLPTLSQPDALPTPAKLDPVQPDVGDDARRVEFQEAALARRGRAKGAAIPAHAAIGVDRRVAGRARIAERSEEHTSELQSLMRISYSFFCLKKKNIQYKLYSCQLLMTQSQEA